MIPFVDLQIQHNQIQAEINTAVSRIIEQGNFIGGKEIAEFEAAFAAYIGVTHCIGCANGTDSIEILLQSMGIGQGDEVIVPAISWIATSEAVSTVGATPIFVDVDPVFYTIDISKIEQAITANTKAIIPVHLYGQAVDMDSIMQIAKQHSLFVIEDCAQAHGAEWNGKKIGSFGDAASFSFFPGKNLGAFGDAGCMVTNNTAIAKKARMIANHGQEGKHNHIIEGRNSRLDTLHAAILQIKLPHLQSWNQKRIEAAQLYSKLITNKNIVIPKVQANSKHVFHLFVIQNAKRNELQTYLLQNNIHTAIHYPKALPFLACYASKQYTESDFPNAFALQNSILSLPLFPFITEQQIQEVCNILNAF